MLDIHSIMRGLAQKRPIFHSEADFQHALAWQVKEIHQETEIRLEYKPFPYESSRMHLDMWLPSERTVIELKYPPTSLDVTPNEEHFLLKEGADDLDRYGFVKDISRIEQVIGARSDVSRGFAVLLTNNDRLWKEPTRTWRTTNDAWFRIHDGRWITGEMDWVKKAPDKQTATSIKLCGTYEMQWHDYRDLETLDSTQIHKGTKFKFRYLAVEVGK